MRTQLPTMAEAPPVYIVNSAQRSTKRRLLRLPAWITVRHADGPMKYVAMVRDMTREGIFFYSDFQPKIGDEIDFVLSFPKWTNTPTVECQGRVLRVEQPDPTAHPGIAVRLTRFSVVGITRESRPAGRRLLQLTAILDNHSA